MHVTKEKICVRSAKARLQVAKPAAWLPHTFCPPPYPYPPSSPPWPPSCPRPVLVVVVLSLLVAVSHKVSPSANRTTNNHKVAALCRNRIPTLGPRMPAGIKVVGPLIAPKDITPSPLLSTLHLTPKPVPPGDWPVGNITTYARIRYARAPHNDRGDTRACDLKLSNQ